MWDVTTRGEKIPKSINNFFDFFTGLLGKNNDHLPPTTNTPDMGYPVVKYNNLSYSGNFLLYRTAQFEDMGTFNFHVEQFIIFMIAEGVCFREKSNDEDDQESGQGMCANGLAYGPPGIGKSKCHELPLSVFRHTFEKNTYSSAKADFGEQECADSFNNVAKYNDEAPALIAEGDSPKMMPEQQEKISQLKEALSDGKLTCNRLEKDLVTGRQVCNKYTTDVSMVPR